MNRSLRSFLLVATAATAIACGGSGTSQSTTAHGQGPGDGHGHAHGHAKHGGPGGHGDAHEGHGKRRPHGAHKGHKGHGTQAAHGPHKEHDRHKGHGHHRNHKTHGSHGKHGEQHNHVHKGPVGHRFAKAEDWVPRFEGPQRDAWQKPAHVVSLMAISPGMTVADIGAGTGYFLPHLAKAVGAAGKVWGLDIEADMVRYMKQKAAKHKMTNVDARKVATDDPGLAAASTDRVLIVNTWHHIANRTAYAKKLAAGLKSGGAVYVVDFTMDSKVGPPKNHRLKSDVVLAELKAGGLDASLIAEQLPNQYIVVGRKK